MLIPFGTLAASGGDLGSYDLLETYILGSSQASITFSSLGTYSSTYKHLQVRAVTKASNTSVRRTDITLNSATSNYSWHELYGSGSSVSSAGLSARVNIPSWDSAPTSSNIGTGVVMDIFDFASTTKNTTLRTLFGFESGTTARNIVLSSGALHSTEAITSITFTIRTDAYAIGSRFSLYGIKG